MKTWNETKFVIEQNANYSFEVIFFLFLQTRTTAYDGSAVAELSKSLLSRDKINKNQKDPRFAPGLGNTVKNSHLRQEL